MKKVKLAIVLATFIAISGCKKASKSEMNIEQDLVVTTFAGSGSSAYKDGIGNRASFSLPSSIVCDSKGNIFVADARNARIRKVTPSGEVSTFAGSGIPGYADGTGIAAQFGNGDNCLAIDAQNNLYLTDTKNSCIRKITPDGIVSTFAGKPGRSFKDGPIASAGFEMGSGDNINSIDIDASNNIYLLDNGSVRKIAANGDVSTFVKVGSTNTSGPAGIATIAQPITFTLDKTGNLYVIATRNFSDYVVRKVTPNGTVSIITDAVDKGYVNGDGLIAKFSDPRGMATDKDGNIYIAEATSHVIRKISTDNFVSTYAGIQYIANTQSAIDGLVLQSKFAEPQDIAFDSNGIMYVLERSFSNIRKISLVDKPTTPPTQAEIDKANWNKATNWK